MEKKLFRKKNKFFSKLLNGIFLSYVSVDNILEGPLREFLKRYFDLEEFGSNNREESLYYLILFFWSFPDYHFSSSILSTSDRNQKWKNSS